MKKIKFPLILKDEYPARNMEELREYFDIEKIYECLCDGRLLSWLEDRQYGEAEEIKECDELDDNLAERLCEIFRVEYEEQYSHTMKELQKARTDFILVGRESRDSGAKRGGFFGWMTHYFNSEQKPADETAEEFFDVEDSVDDYEDGFIVEDPLIDDSADEESSVFISSEKYGSHGTLEEFRIAEILEVGTGGELLIENKKVIFENRIIGGDNARLIFRNCEISVDGYRFRNKIPSYSSDSQNCINLNRDCKIDFENCTFKRLGINKKERYSYSLRQSWFIYCILGKLSIINCYFEELQDIFYSGDSALIKHSYINLVADEWSDSLFRCDNMEICNSTIYEKEKNEDIYHSLFDIETYFRIDTCHFFECSHLYFDRTNTEVYNSSFEKCAIAVEKSGILFAKKKDGEILFKECKFDACNFDKGSEAYAMRFENSKLLSCVGELPTRYMKKVISDGGFLYIDTKRKAEFIDCRFANWSYKPCEQDLWNMHAVLIVGNGSKILNCSFENLDLGKTSLFGGMADSSAMSCQIANCQFENIQIIGNGIFNKQYSYCQEGIFKSKFYTGYVELDVKECTGLSS